MRRQSAAAAVISLLIGLMAAPALAHFGETAPIGSNGFSTANLEGATGVSGSTACAGGAKVSLSWTASTSAFADGYDVYRGTTSGGPYTLVGHVIGRNTTIYDDTGLTSSTTYYYVIQATAINWTSVNSSEASATTPAC